MTYYLRTCSGGLGLHAGYDSPSFGGNYYCPKHLWSLMHGFDPQPHGQGGTDQLVKFIDGSTPTALMDTMRSDWIWCVLAREGDLLTLRRLGMPNSASITANVAEVYPANPGAVYRHADRCGKAPAGGDQQ